MYSTYNEEKSVVAERFIRISKNKIYKHMTAVSKNVYLDVLNDVVDKCKHTYHKTIKMKPKNVKSDFYAEHSVESNIKDPNIKVRDYKTISKYTFLPKDMLLIGQKKFL